MLSIVFYLGSLIFLFLSRRNAKKRATQLVRQRPLELLSKVDQALKLSSSGIKWENSRVLQRYSIDKAESVTSQYYIEILSYILLAYSIGSISFADKISMAIIHYHYTIIAGLFILLLTGNAIFEFAFAIFSVLFAALLLLLAVFQIFRTKAHFQAILSTEEITSYISYSFYFYYPFKMLQAPGAAIQWFIDLILPNSISQLNASQK
jgi:hypothetical protein